VVGRIRFALERFGLPRHSSHVAQLYSLGVIRCALSILSLCFLLFATGCVHALHPYNSPSQQKICVQSPSPDHLVIRVADTQDYPVASDGRVTFDVPRLPRGCAVYFLGVKVSDSRSEDVRAIHLLRDGSVVRRLSLAQIDKLPVDAEGYHTVVLR
jgi:hypothetical protein